MRPIHLALGAALCCAGHALANPPVDYGHVRDVDICSDTRVNIDERIDKCKAYLTSGGLGAHDNAVGFNSLGLAYFEKHDYPSALDSFGTAIKIDPQAWYVYLNRANIYVSEDKSDLAFDDCNTALAINPDAWQVYAVRAGLYRARGRHDLEMADFTHAVTVNPTAQTYRLRAEAYGDDELDKALADLNESVKLEPDNVRSLHKRAILNERLGNNDAELADYRHLMALSKHQNLALNIRAQAEYNLKLDDDAVKDYTAIVAQDPKDAAAIFWRGNVYERTQRLELALADYNAAITLAPRDAGYLIARGTLYERRDDYPHAIADIDAALALAPDTASLWNNACWTRAVANTDLVKGEDDCKHALTMKPNDPAALDSLGFVQYRLGHLADARASYDAAVAGAPKQAASAYMRGIVRRHAGDTAGGDADIAAANALDPKIAATFAKYGVSP